MIAEGENAYEEASESLKAAEWEKQNYASQMRNHATKVSYYRDIILRTKNEIWQTSQALKAIKIEIDGVQKHLKGTADIQEMVRKVVKLLNVLNGRVTVLEIQTKRIVVWKPVIKIMEEVVKAIVHITENRFLYSNGVPSFVYTLRENVTGMLALCRSPSNSEFDSYY